MKNKTHYCIAFFTLLCCCMASALTAQNVGIGTTLPLSDLHIRDNITDTTGTDGVFLSIQNGSENALSTDRIMSGIRFKNNSGVISNYFNGALFFRRQGTGGRSDFIFANSGTSVSATIADHKMTLTSFGRLGLGTLNPEARMDVRGLLRMDSIQVTTDAAAGRVLVSNAQGKALWKDPSLVNVNAWGLNGNSVASSNFIGTTNLASFFGRANDRTALIVDVFSGNTTLGYQAGDSLDILTGTGISNTRENVAIGWLAGLNLEDGDFNILVGAQAGEFLNTGNWNTAIGYNTMSVASDAESNTYVGFFAGLNALGDGNIGIGALAGAGLTGGDQQNNVCIGNYAGRRLWMAKHNVNLGDSTGFSNRTATGNVFIGHGAGVGLVTATGPGSADTATGAFNIFLGYRAGRTYTSGSNNILIGRSTGDSLTTASGNILIGENIQLTTPETNNSLNIGNTLFGRLALKRIGIGENNPLLALHIKNQGVSDGILIEGDGNDTQVDLRLDNNNSLGGHEWVLRSTGGTFGAGGGKFLLRDNDAGWNRMVIDSVGNFGFGLPDPEEKMHLQGNHYIRLQSDIDQGSSGKELGIQFGGGDGLGGFAQLGFIGLKFDSDNLHIDADRFIMIGVDGSDLVTITETDRVGIGVALPLAELDVAGSICASVSVGVCSDVRYKKNITPLRDVSPTLDQIDAVYYYWKQDAFPERKFGEDRQIGFIAQELEAVFPEVVMTDDNGYKSVDYPKMTAILWQAVKEQNVKIEELEEQMAAINAKLERSN